MNPPGARTVELTYHRAKVDPNPDLLGCLALLIALPLIGYGLIAFFSGHDQTAIFWYGLPGTLLVVASHVTPRLSRKSDAEFAQSFEAQVAEARAKDLRAEDVINDLGSNPRPLWLFFRPFELENQLLAVSTDNAGVREAPHLIDYPEEGFADPKHQPVDLFDRLQSGFTSAASAAAVAVGRRPHPLHLDVGFVASTDADWRQHVEALAAAASVIVAMPWDTPGVLWETEYLTAGLLHKTIFVMPPAYQAVATLKTHGHLFPFPWFAVEANSDALAYARRWARAIEPLLRRGLVVPTYNWHGLLFGYGEGGTPFSLRIPVHTREFLSVCAAIRERRR